MEKQHYGLTFEEIVEQLNNSDCNEIILGHDGKDDTYTLCDVLIIYKKYEKMYVFRRTLKGDNYVIIEREINDAFVECVYVNDVISMFYLNTLPNGRIKWPIMPGHVLYNLLEIMHQNDWKHPQITEWSENPCFK